MSATTISKDEYETAVRKYNKSNLISVSLAFLFMILSTYGFSLICLHGTSTSCNEESDLTRSRSGHLMLLEMGLFLFVTYGLPITCMICFDRHLKRRPSLHCPYCKAFIGMERTSTHILKTGMCRQCKEMLFEGEFATKSEILQYYHQLKVDANQRSKSAMKITPRFIILTTTFSITSTLLIYAWMKSLNESLREPSPSIFAYLAPFLLMAVVICVLVKQSLKECERIDEELRKTEL